MKGEPPAGSDSAPDSFAPSKPGQGSEEGQPFADPGSNSHKPETRIGKLTYELRKTEIAAEIRKEEIRAQIRLAELAEGGDDKENDRATQVLLDRQRNRTLLGLVIGVGVIVLTGVGYYFGKDADWTLPGLGGFKSHQSAGDGPEAAPSKPQDGEPAAP